MATPNPPPSTHQTSDTAAPNRRRHKRHAPQQDQPPEEPPTPAPTGRACGFAPPPAGAASAATSECLASSLGAPSAVLAAEQAVEGMGSKARRGRSRSRSGRPPPTAENAVSGTPLQRPETLHSNDPTANVRRGMVEGVVGFDKVLPGSTSSTPTSNGDTSNSGRIRPDCAPQVFDGMSERDPDLDYPMARSGDVSGVSMDPSLAAGQNLEGVSWRPGAKSATAFTAWSVQADCAVTGPVCHDFGQIGVATDFDSGREAIRGQGGMQEGILGCSSSMTREAEAPRQGNAGTAKKATRIGAVAALSGPDLAQIAHATDFDPWSDATRGLGGTQEGQLGCRPRVVREAEAPRLGNAGPVNTASQIAAERDQPRPDLAQLDHATDFGSYLRRPLEQGGLQEGGRDFSSGVVQEKLEFRT